MTITDLRDNAEYTLSVVDGCEGYFCNNPEFGLATTVVELNKRRWTTKSWTTRRGRHHQGKPFQKASLRRMLLSPVYLGKLLHDGTIYEGEHEGIVDANVWERTQKLLTKNGSNGGRDVRNRYGALLKGILRCAPCDSVMTHTYVRKNQRLYRYYTCSRAQRIGWASCPTKSLPAEEIEQCIYERIRTIGSDPELVKETIRAARKHIKEQTTQLDAEIRITEKQLSRLQKEKQRLLESIGHGGSVATKAAERLDQVDQEIESTSSQLSSLERQLSDVQDQRINPDDLTGAIAQFDPIWDVLLPRERVRIVRLLIQQVDFDGKTGTMGITFQPVGIKALIAEAMVTRKEAK